jgi:hypothetical protein
MSVPHDVDLATLQGISHIEAIRQSGQREPVANLKSTRLA